MEDKGKKAKSRQAARRLDKARKSDPEVLMADVRRESLTQSKQREKREERRQRRNPEQE